MIVRRPLASKRCSNDAKERIVISVDGILLTIAWEPSLFIKIVDRSFINGAAVGNDGTNGNLLW